jgi:hypothetical protein
MSPGHLPFLSKREETHRRIQAKAVFGIAVPGLFGTTSSAFICVHPNSGSPDFGFTRIRVHRGGFKTLPCFVIRVRPHPFLV